MNVKNGAYSRAGTGFKTGARFTLLKAPHLERSCLFMRIRHVFQKNACIFRKYLINYCLLFLRVHVVVPAKEVQNTMAKCDICGKSVAFGIQVSHSHRRSNRTWKPNIKRVKAVVNGSPKRIYACSRCLRSGKVTRAV